MRYEQVTPNQLGPDHLQMHVLWICDGSNRVGYDFAAKVTGVERSSDGFTWWLNVATIEGTPDRVLLSDRAHIALGDRERLDKFIHDEAQRRVAQARGWSNE